MPVVPGWKTFHMARPSLHRWLKHVTHTRRPVRRYTEFVCGRRYRPHVEGLEDRCVPSTVTNLNDAGAGSLHDALVTTPAGGTVDFQPGLTGTITLTSGELDIGQDLTIAWPGAGVIIVSGNHAFEVFNIAASAMVNVSGLTIANGSADDGGGIFNAGTLSLSNSTVSSNSADRGGGICNAGTVTISASTFGDNTANGLDIDFPSSGGAVFNGGMLTLSNSILSGNSASGVDISLGGGISNSGTAIISYTTLSGNSSFFGGGIYNSGTLNLGSSTLNGNFTLSGNTTDAGGGILNDVPALTISNSTLNRRLFGEGPDDGSGAPSAPKPSVSRRRQGQGANVPGLRANRAARGATNNLLEELTDYHRARTAHLGGFSPDRLLLAARYAVCFPASVGRTLRSAARPTTAGFRGLILSKRYAQPLSRCPRVMLLPLSWLGIEGFSLCAAPKVRRCQSGSDSRARASVCCCGPKVETSRRASRAQGPGSSQRSAAFR